MGSVSIDLGRTVLEEAGFELREAEEEAGGEEIEAGRSAGAKLFVAGTSAMAGCLAKERPKANTIKVNTKNTAMTPPPIATQTIG